jgi:hypothetical protein
MAASNTALQRNDQANAIEQVVIQGDLKMLSAEQRVQYYNRVCESVGLNPYTQPFGYITLNGKLTLYCKRDATDQLRKIHGVSILDLIESEREGVYIVTAKAQDSAGRTDIAKGAVTINSLKGEALANAIMKAETKAKRRVTLSICGLGWVDETEIETIPQARTVQVKPDGEIIEEPKPIETKAQPSALQQEIIDLWKKLEGMGQATFAGKDEKLAHLRQTAAQHKWDVGEISGLRDVPETYLDAYKSVLIDYQAAAEDEIF